MSKKMVVDVNNIPIAFYETIVNPAESIPADAIDITEEQWLEFIENRGKRKWNPSTLAVENYTPTIPLADIKSIKISEIVTAYVDELKLGYTCPTSDIKMDMMLENINMLEDGYNLAVSQGETVMDIMDYDNVKHTNITTVDVNIILTELKLQFRTLLTKKWDLRSQVDIAVDEPAVNLINW